MFITAKVWKEDDSWIAEIPSIDGVTYCGLDEDILDYVVDYMKCLDIDVEARRESDSVIAMKVLEPRTLIAQILKRLRGDKTLSEVARKGMTRTMFHQYERGSRDASLATFSKLLSALGADFEIVVRRNAQ